jgi:hypothetical protein
MPTGDPTTIELFSEFEEAMYVQMGVVREKSKL